jgi:tyrosine-specific transport protein
MNQKPGSLFGGVLLICGSCIGAGMLGLPVLTGLAGFFPSLSVFLAAWFFMTITGLLLVEVNGWFSHKANIITMVGHTLGQVGKMLSWTLYLFLFYALLVAYISGSDFIFSSFFGIPEWLSSLIFTSLFGCIIYWGTKAVDHWNRFLVAAMIIAYIALVSLGVNKINLQLLLHRAPVYSLIALPVLVTSFGYHNMIPTLTAYMKGDLKRVRLTIIYGSLLALAIYLSWEVLVLGIVPLEGTSGLIDSYKNGKEGAQALAMTLNSSWIAIFARIFAFFAILTSFLAQALSLVHFLSDGFQIKHKKKENIWMCLTALLPPVFFALIQPHLFLKALSFGGGIASVLFGIVPVLMIWRGRYYQKMPSKYQVSGGKPLLVLIFLFALLVFVFQIASMVNAPFLPHV